MNTQRNIDVAVVGAGPAGSAAAIVLARAGCRVTVLERARFPRIKTCGGCLSGAAVQTLARLVPELVPLCGSPVQKISFSIGDQTYSTPAMGKCRIIPRERLDALLANDAKRAGATVAFGEPAKLVECAPRLHAIELARHRFRPDWIIWAAGAGSIRGPADGTVHQHARSSCCIGQAWSFAPCRDCPATGEIALHWLRGGYIGLATFSNERCMAAAMLDARILPRREQWASLQSLNQQSDILRHVATHERAAVSGSAGFPCRPRVPGFSNVLLVGDAAGFEEPFSGEGIGLALESGIAAARAILSGGERRHVVARFAAGLRHHRMVRLRTRWLGSMLRSRAGHWLASRSLPLSYSVGQMALRHIHVLE